MRLYTTEQLGPKREKTPEGFLVCYDVPIARTGIQIYGPGEVPVPPGPDGLVRINREEAEVFRPESISSIVGKPVVNDHPDEDVTPANWRELSCGHVLAARRGDGELRDFLVGDIMVTCPDAIRDIDEGKREVSCGYDPDYDRLVVEDGAEPPPYQGRQRNILYNHLALVGKGRCGPRCAIGDHKTTDHAKKENIMANTKKGSLFDRLRASLAGHGVDAKTFDAAFDAAATTNDDDPTNPLAHHVEVHNHMNPSGPDVGDDLPARVEKLESGMGAVHDMVKKVHDKMFGGRDAEKEEEEKKAKDAKDTEEKEKKEKETEDEAILGQLEMEAPPGTSDRARKARDSAFLADSFQETVALAEIIVPGARAPAFDRAMEPRKTFDAICTFRRQTIDLAYAKPETRPAIDGILGGRSLDTKNMTCDAVRTMFRTLAALRRAENNGGARTVDFRSAKQPGGKIQTIADLNKATRDLWNPQQNTSKAS